MSLSKKMFACIAAGLLASTSAGAAVFEKTNEYTSETFNDVSATEWYADEVAGCYELGFMNGIGEGIFNPAGNVTVAEAMTVACRVHAVYNGAEIEKAQDGIWYEPYAKYAKANGIISSEPDSYDRPAKRYEVAQFFKNAVPEDFYVQKNCVDSIPDISEAIHYHDDVLTLYKAGVVMGNDSYGNFFPENNITRAETAAIINRVAFPENRLQRQLDEISPDEPYMLITDYSGATLSQSSGWLFDLRGAAPQNNVSEQFSGLYDIFEDSGTAFIKEFNKTDTGIVTLNTHVSMYGDGAYLEYRNDKDEPVYRLEIAYGAWNIAKKDGEAVKTIPANGTDDIYKIRIVLDLDNARSTTYVNGENLGTYELMCVNEDVNLINFRYATTKEGIATIKPEKLSISVNFGVNESFTYTDDGAVPFDFTFSGDASVADGELILAENASVSKAFAPISRKLAAEFEMIIPEGESVCYELKSGNKTVVSFTSDEKSFYANGEKVYEDYVSNLWYRMRFELDCDKGNVKVKLNGRYIAEVPFNEAVSSVDNFTVSNKSKGGIKLDEFKVFKLVEHEDYVPAPIKPQGEEKYNVGINICSLWVEGTHRGWACISAFDDIEPVLGYYDEGNPETADWEIKYMVEHGIDFQAFCWFSDSSDGPIKSPGLSYHLHDGYMNAKYSDMMSYCLLIEAANGAVPASVEVWKKHWVPYFIENYFKDSRYMVIDNRLPVAVFGSDSLTNGLGGNAKNYEAFEYLEEKIRELGFDGVIYLTASGANQKFSDMGYDGCFAYSWGNQGYTSEVNMSRILSNASNGFIHTVPTVSVGFNNVAWAGTRYPLMTKEDYITTHRWVLDEHLPAVATKDWQKNFVWLSTWNEYGEGTYIMPTTDEKDFGYLDVLRACYTDEGEDESVNVVPNEKQRKRINRLYPQYRHDLAKKGVYQPDMEQVYFIDYSTHPSGTSSVDLSSVVKDESGFYGKASGNDALIQVTSFDKEIDLSFVPEIRITLKGSMGRGVEIFYKTSESDSWTQDKGTTFSLTSDGFKTYTIKTQGLAKWSGTLTGFRIDPANAVGQDFTVKSAEFLTDYKPNMLSKIVTIDGKSFLSAFAPEINEKGAVVLAFDPKQLMHTRLNIFYLWDKDNGVLTLNFKEHSFVFTVGSDKYTLDGEENDLGFVITETDGLPVIPIQMICEAVGYEFAVNEAKKIEIVTPNKAYFEELAEKRALGIWDFNTPGDVEGWTSPYMLLSTDKGYMRATSTTEFSDPIIWSSEGLQIPADKFNKLEIKVRYKYTSSKLQPIQIYFSTDKSPGMSEAKAIYVDLNSMDSKGLFEEYTVNLTETETWKDTVTRLRFDPFNAYGEMDIEYIRFVYDPELEETETPNTAN